MYTNTKPEICPIYESYIKPKLDQQKCGIPFFSFNLIIRQAYGTARLYNILLQCKSETYITELRYLRCNLD